MPERILIKNRQSPGDIIVMTAALREIHKAHPGKFQFQIESGVSSIYRDNPLLSPFPPSTGRPVEAHYDLVNHSNQRRLHFMWGYLQHFNEVLGTRGVLTEFRPALHLSPEEEASPPYGLTRPYWAFVAGGKKDFTAKIWHPQEWASVVGEMSGWTTMVQLGATPSDHMHPQIPGAVDLVGKTGFRDFMRVIRHAEGVICGVTAAMHIAAAFNKPCVCIAGGREPWWWEAYDVPSRELSMRAGQPSWKPPVPDEFIPHKFLHTIGKLECCADKACWKSFVLPDEDRTKKKDGFCKLPVRDRGRWIPECMRRITAQQVLGAVEWYYDAGILTRKPLPKPAKAPAASPVPKGPLDVRTVLMVPRGFGHVLGDFRTLVDPSHVTVRTAEQLESSEFLRIENGEIQRPLLQGEDSVLALPVDGPELAHPDILRAAVQANPGCLLGVIRRSRLTESVRAAALTAPWYRCKPFLPLDLRTGNAVLHPEYGPVVVPPVLQGLWPDVRIPWADNWLLLGEAARQLGIPQLDIGKAVRYG